MLYISTDSRTRCKFVTILQRFWLWWCVGLHLGRSLYIYYSTCLREENLNIRLGVRGWLLRGSENANEFPDKIYQGHTYRFASNSTPCCNDFVDGRTTLLCSDHYIAPSLLLFTSFPSRFFLLENMYKKFVYHLYSQRNATFAFSFGIKRIKGKWFVQSFRLLEWKLLIKCRKGK